jgi:hypothetical protein
MQSREAIIESIQEWLIIRHAALQQDNLQGSREAKTVISQLTWVLEEEFVEDIPEISDDEWKYDVETDYVEQIGNDLEADDGDE